MLSGDTLAETLGSMPVDLLCILDKGTFKQYDDYGKPGLDVLVIDHHPPQGIPEDVLLYNPNSVSHAQTSTSMLTHMISTHLGISSPWVDLMNLIGLKGDFAIEPVMGFVAPHCLPFYQSVRQKFSELLAPTKDQPTLFDVEQRRRSSLLNQLTEILHIVCGGGVPILLQGS